MFSKVILIAALLAVGHATNVLVNTGLSSTSRQQDSDGNYAFAYDIIDAQGATNSRSETGDSQGNVQGRYSLKDTDGRARTVDYIANKEGYRAVVKTNEPGTARSAPAAVVVDSPYELPVAPEAPAPAPEVVTPAPAPAPKPITSTSSHITIVHDVPAARPVSVLVTHPAPVVVARPVKVVRPEPVAHPVPVVNVFHGVHAARPVFAPLPVAFSKPGLFYPSFGNYKGSPY